MREFNLNEFVERINISKLPHSFQLYTYDDHRYNYHKNCGFVKLEFIYSQKNFEEPVFINIYFKYVDYNNTLNFTEEIFDVDRYFVEDLDKKVNDLVAYLKNLIK